MSDTQSDDARTAGLALAAGTGDRAARGTDAGAPIIPVAEGAEGHLLGGTLAVARSAHG